MPKHFVLAKQERCNVPRHRLDLEEETGHTKRSAPVIAPVYSLTIGSFDDPEGVTIVVPVETYEIHHLGEEVQFAIVGVTR